MTSHCNRTTDNKHFDCPPKMADGRHFTDYRPSCDIDVAIRNDNSIKNNFQYRKFLQTNGVDIMNINRQHSCMKNCCTPCSTNSDNFNGGTMLPEKYLVECDEHTCTRKLNDPKGLGDGRVYYKEPLECAGFPAVWPNVQGVNKCASPHDNFYYYGDLKSVGIMEEGEMLRNAHPLGGVVMQGGDPRAAPQ